MDLDDPGKGPERHPAKQAPEISPLLLSTFERYAGRSLARQFYALRLSQAQRPDPMAIRGKPLIVYFNHPSWWDPLICLRLAEQFFPDRKNYAPLDVAVLGKDRFFERLGFFGVELDTARGARRFLTLSQQALSRPDSALWIAAEGRLADPRVRPVRLRSGIGHLAVRVRQAVLLPLALEYPFWEERRPEALARFGEEIPAGEAGLKATDWTAVLETRLQAALDALAAESIARDPSRFDLLRGGAPAGTGMSDAWRRLKARFRGERSLQEPAGGELPEVPRRRI
ncbi:MAG TPA: lysophospholipid acyltransferase family protein [Thermoanaerobaculia bacterium]|nr:lysophospholipid acyltransferase family protein [Thermoanaerobaculia bacterium]